MALPQAIEFDQTPNKLLYQVAENERERQRQLELLRQKDEAARLEAFGGAQKSIIEATKNIPFQAQQQILAEGYNNLKELFKNKNLSTAEVTYRASDVVGRAVSSGAAYNSYLQTGKDLAAKLKDQGWNETEIQAAISNNLFKTVPVQDANGKISYTRSLRTPEELDNPNNFLQKELKLNPQRYWNRKSFAEGFEKYTSGFKPAFDKQSTTTDPTGRVVSTAQYNLEMFPWTKTITEKDPLTGLDVQYSVLDTQEIKLPDGKTFKVVSPQAMDRLTAGYPDLATDALVGGMDLIAQENRRRGFNPAMINEQNVDQFIEMGAVNPYDEGNRKIYSSLYLTNHPSMQKFNIRRDVDVSKKTDNPPRVTVNVTGAENEKKPVHVIDRLDQIEKLNSEFYTRDWKNKSGEQFYDVTSQFSFNIIKDAGGNFAPAKVIYTTGTKKNPKPHYLVYESKGDQPIEKSRLDMENWLIPAIQDMGYDTKKFQKIEDKKLTVAEMLRKNKK